MLMAKLYTAFGPGGVASKLLSTVPVKPDERNAWPEMVVVPADNRYFIAGPIAGEYREVEPAIVEAKEYFHL